MTKQETSKKVKGMIKADFGMSFTELKKEIIKTVDYPGSSSDHFKSKRGYAIFYTDNDNYMQGAWNGGGKGFFASLQGVGTCSVIKLSK